MVLLATADLLYADELRIEIKGVKGPILTNVRTSVEPFRITMNSHLSSRQLEQQRETSEQQALVALRPFGYYHATVTSEISSIEEGVWLLNLNIKRGPPVRVSEVSVEITGSGATLDEFKLWQTEWPLVKGKILNQQKWDTQKQRALDIAEDNGYLLANFSRARMEVNLEDNEAALSLTLDTGEQAVIGQIQFMQDRVKSHVLDNLPRFRPGDPYNAWLMEKFRVDVWKTGYFSNIEVIEDRKLTESPPRVDLVVNLESRKNNTYQGTLGYGSDTGPRLLFSWNRHLLSSNGDSFSLGTGWQQQNNELFVRGNYRLPRDVKTRQFWIADVQLKNENQDLTVSDDDYNETQYTLANSSIEDYSARFGRLKVYDSDQGYRQLFETMYAQYLKENVDYNPAFSAPEDLVVFGELFENDPRLHRSTQSLAFGIDYDMPLIRGEGFDTVGYHHRASAFISNTAWGSDEDYSQIYLSSNWNFMAGRRWKFLLRGEVGYSDADVNNFDLSIDGKEIRLSVTDLPNLYRFKAGGSSSIRGYAYESISNNGIGSNNILTASAEVELSVLPKWSVAAFFDIGDAFNEWNNLELFKGVGVGVRWYSIAGPIRLDLAQGLDLPGQPWRIHFSIGISLL